MRGTDCLNRFDPPLRMAYLSSARELEENEMEILLALREDNPHPPHLWMVDDHPSELTDAQMNCLQSAPLSPVLVDSKSFRSIPSSQYEFKARQKAEYESRIIDLLNTHQIDILFCEQYMCLVGPTLLASPYAGLILNLHPADAKELPGLGVSTKAIFRHHLFRRIASAQESAASGSGRTPTYRIPLYDADELAMANQLYTHLPGASVEVNSAPPSGSNAAATLVLSSPPRNWSCAKNGLTFHEIDSSLDAGPPILSTHSTPVRRAHFEHELRMEGIPARLAAVRAGLPLWLSRPQVQFRISLLRQSRARLCESPSSQAHPVRRAAIPSA